MRKTGSSTVLLALLCLLFSLPSSGAKTILTNGIDITSEDLHYCDLAPAGSDEYAKCHNYVGISMAAGRPILSEYVMQPALSDSTGTRNLAIMEVGPAYFDETVLQMDCIFDELLNATICRHSPVTIRNVRFVDPRPLPASLSLSPERRWFDIYWEMPNSFERTWNLTLSGGSAQPAILDPNTTSACGNLASPNQVYELNQSISAASSCIYVLADNVTLDCNGFIISGSRAPGSVGITIANRRNVTIRDCKIKNFNTGVKVSGSREVELEGIDVSEQFGYAVASVLTYGLKVESSSQVHARNLVANSIYSRSLVQGSTAFGAYFYNSTNSSIEDFICSNITSISASNVGYQYGLYLNGVNSSNFSDTYDDNRHHFNIFNSSRLSFRNTSFSYDPQKPEFEYFFRVYASEKIVFDGANSPINNVSNEIFYFHQSKDLLVKNYVVKYGAAPNTNINILWLQNVNNSQFSNNSFENFSQYHYAFLTTTRDLAFNDNAFVGTYGTDSQALFSFSGTVTNLSFIRNTIANISLDPSFEVYYGDSQTKNLNFTANQYVNLRKGLYRVSGESCAIDEMYVNSTNPRIAFLVGSNFTFVNFSSAVVSNISYSGLSEARVRHYAAVNVTDEASSLVSGAKVNITNSSSSFPEYLNLEAVDGITNPVLVTEFIGNKTVNVTYAPHNFTAARDPDYFPESVLVYLNHSLTVRIALVQKSVNESTGRAAILEGIRSAIPDSAIQADQKVYLVDQQGGHSFGSFDEVATLGNQAWGFNYLTGNETATGIGSLFNVVNVWEQMELSYAQIVQQVSEFISGTQD